MRSDNRAICSTAAPSPPIKPGAARSAASPHRASVAAPVRGRLISDPRVVVAIGQALDRRAAAEEELGGAGVADRPAALALVELEQRAALPDRYDVLDQLGLGLDILLVHRGERRIAAHRRACEPRSEEHTSELQS